jgi:hypothetical protein
MPRFFFHLFNDVVTDDLEGQELADVEAAVREARHGARALAAEQVQQGRLVLHHHIMVEDSNGRTVAKVTFGDAIAIED